jgi:hypothetical protein
MQGENLSLQEKVRAARKRRERDLVVRVPIPGWPLLIGRYKMVDWRVKGEIDLRHEVEEDVLEKMRLVQTDFLIAASDGVEAVDDGERVDLGVTLGLGLAGWLGINEPTSDGSPLAADDQTAVALIIDDGEDLLEHATVVRTMLRGESEQVGEQIVGESKAAS